MTGVIFEPWSRNSDGSDFASRPESDLKPSTVFSRRMPESTAWNFDAGVRAWAWPPTMPTAAVTVQATTIESARLLTTDFPGACVRCVRMSNLSSTTARAATAANRTFWTPSDERRLLPLLRSPLHGTPGGRRAHGRGGVRRRARRLRDHPSGSAECEWRGDGGGQGPLGRLRHRG